MTITLSRSCLAGVCLLLSGLPFAHAADTRLFAGQSGTLDIAGGTAHIPVVEDGRMVGVVSIGDLVKETISSQQFIISELERYITG